MCPTGPWSPSLPGCLCPCRVCQSWGSQKIPKIPLPRSFPLCDCTEGCTRSLYREVAALRDCLSLEQVGKETPCCQQHTLMLTGTHVSISNHGEILPSPVIQWNYLGWAVQAPLECLCPSGEELFQQHSAAEREPGSGCCHCGCASSPWHPLLPSSNHRVPDGVQGREQATQTMSLFTFNTRGPSLSHAVARVFMDDGAGKLRGDPALHCAHPSPCSLAWCLSPLIPVDAGIHCSILMLPVPALPGLQAAQGCS